jgi:cobyrinic acid a,c-diamide synthase
MPPALLDRLFATVCADAEIVLVESAMGLFDGVAAAPGRTGSSADLAARFGLPVLLILDVSGQAQTAAAVAHGLATFDPSVQVGGVVLNRVASDRHRRSVEQAMRLPVLGAIPKDASVTLPERHLGLVQASELGDLQKTLNALADLIERCIDVSTLLQTASLLPPAEEAGGEGSPLPPPGQRIALAQDAAFTFTYPHLLAAWRAAGAELLPFAPLANEPPPDAADCCWLPGGYPELHAPALAAATRFTAGLQRFAQTRPVHGECGGYMVLGRSLTAADGTTHAMTGLLSHATSFARRRLTLGYRRATLPGRVMRGHEFHYATMTDPGTDAPYATVEDATGAALGPSGGRRGPVTGSFFHAIASEAP